MMIYREKISTPLASLSDDEQMKLVTEAIASESHWAKGLVGRIAVVIDGLHLGDPIREHLDHGDGDRLPRVREDARHAALAADQTDSHVLILSKGTHNAACAPGH